MTIVRQMLNSDIAQVSQIMCLCYKWLAQKNNYNDQQIAYLLSERGSIQTIQMEMQNQMYLVAETDGDIVGMAAVKNNELAKLYVEPRYHGQGIGTLLFNTVQHTLIEAGHKEMIVGVMTRTAIGFYEKNGMTAFGEKLIKTGVFAGTKVLLMTKTLSDI